MTTGDGRRRLGSVAANLIIRDGKSETDLEGFRLFQAGRRRRLLLLEFGVNSS
jgi:hypothetical protein